MDDGNVASGFYYRDYCSNNTKYTTVASNKFGKVAHKI